MEKRRETGRSVGDLELEWWVEMWSGQAATARASSIQARVSTRSIINYGVPIVNWNNINRMSWMKRWRCDRVVKELFWHKNDMSPLSPERQVSRLQWTADDASHLGDRIVGFTMIIQIKDVHESEHSHLLSRQLLSRSSFPYFSHSLQMMQHLPELFDSFNKSWSCSSATSAQWRVSSRYWIDFLVFLSFINCTHMNTRWGGVREIEGENVLVWSSHLHAGGREPIGWTASF